MKHKTLLKENALYKLYELREEYKLKIAQGICPRCNGILVTDWDSITCLNCGWRHD